MHQVAFYLEKLYNIVHFFYLNFFILLICSHAYINTCVKYIQPCLKSVGVENVQHPMFLSGYDSVHVKS